MLKNMMLWVVFGWVNSITWCFRRKLRGVKGGRGRVGGGGGQGGCYRRIEVFGKIHKKKFRGEGRFRGGGGGGVFGLWGSGKM